MAILELVEFVSINMNIWIDHPSRVKASKIAQIAFMMLLKLTVLY